MNPLLLALPFIAITQPSDFFVPQTNVIDYIGCGTGCRIYFEQLSPVEELSLGWKRVKIAKRMFLYNRDLEKFEQRGFRQPEPSTGKSIGWNYANCSSEKFVYRSFDHKDFASWFRHLKDNDVQNVYYPKGDQKQGQPVYETVTGSPFQQWSKLCPNEAKRGYRFIEKGNKALRLMIKMINQDPSVDHLLVPKKNNGKTN